MPRRHWAISRTMLLDALCKISRDMLLLHCYVSPWRSWADTPGSPPKSEAPRNTMRYLVMTLRTPAFDPAAADAHRAYLDRLRDRGTVTLAGPFADQSGGAYLLAAGSLREARAVAHDDPLHKTGASQLAVYEWDAS